MWVDAHAHLYDLDDNGLSEAVHACETAGVAAILNTATSLETSRVVLSQCATRPFLYGAVGISPFDAEGLPASWPDRLAALLSDPRAVALGETGIDTTNPAYPDIRLQLPLFERQLDIASGHDLPVIVHSRGCESRAVDICRRQGVRKALFHCFTGDVSSARKIIDAGYLVSFSGIITFKNTSLIECVDYVPLTSMLVETDSPYLAPAPHRGKRNRPEWVVYVGKKVAEIKKMDEEKAAKVMLKNFRNLFKLPRAIFS
jgi:TatD DNase family protein